MESDSRPELLAWQERRARTLDDFRSEAREKRHAKGYRTARENVADLVDADSFQEYGQLAVAAQRSRRDYQELQSSTAADGIITGTCTINAEHVGPAAARAAIIVNDYAVLAGTQGYFHHKKLDRILESMATRGWDSFVVELLDGDHFVGICGLAPQTIDDINEVELGYRLMPEFWGRGMATEAACACRDYAFKNLGMPRIIAIIEPANAGSIRVTEKVGLRFEKETREWDRHVQIFSAHADGQFEMPT